MNDNIEVEDFSDELQDEVLDRTGAGDVSHFLATSPMYPTMTRV